MGNKSSSSNLGAVVSVRGSVVDIRFEELSGCTEILDLSTLVFNSLPGFSYNGTAL
jgi:hypothetical protein